VPTATTATTQVTDRTSQRVAQLTAAAARLLQIPHCPHVPTPRQARFLLEFSREALFGGAAGGGKSDAILMAALQYIDVPGYAAIAFRKSYSDLSLPGALMDRAKSWLADTSARWKEDEKTFVFPSGATLTFGYLERDLDRYRYQGSEYQFIGFDELTQIAETNYLYLFSRLRRPQARSNPALGAVPLRMRAASNPGGIGHDWVYRRFFVEGPAKGRVFVPSKLDDNPHLDQAEYRHSLSELDPVTRAQLLHGDWTVRPEGRVFRRDWFPIVAAAPPDCTWVRYWDLAASDPGPSNPDPDYTAGALLGRSRSTRMFYLADMARFRGSPEAVERRLVLTSAADGRLVRRYIEQEPGGAGKAHHDALRRGALADYPFGSHRSTGDKVTRAASLAAQAEGGRVHLVSGPWNSDFLDELAGFPDGAAHDDQVDAACGAMEKLIVQAAPLAGGPISIQRSDRGWRPG